MGKSLYWAVRTLRYIGIYNSLREGLFPNLPAMGPYCLTPLSDVRSIARLWIYIFIVFTHRVLRDVRIPFCAQRGVLKRNEKLLTVGLR